jgi:hypothetical protein
VSFGVGLGGVLMVIVCVQSMAVGHFMMMCCFVVIAFFVRFVRFVMVMCCSFVVLGRMVMVIVLGHQGFSS